MKNEGKTMDEIRDWLVSRGYSPQGLKEIIRSAGNDMKTVYEEYLAEGAKFQWQRLDKIITDCLGKKDYKNALKAIDLQAKITKLYEVNVVNNTQINTEAIEITFN